MGGIGRRRAPRPDGHQSSAQPGMAGGLTAMTAKRTVTAFGIVALVVAACSSVASPSPSAGWGGASAPASGGGGSDKPVIGFSQANGGDEWRTNQNNKVKEHCEKIGETRISDAQG